MPCPRKTRKMQRGGNNSIFLAAEKGDINTLKELLTNNKGINETGNSRKTPLFIASQKGYFEIVKLLLEKGADVNKAAKRGISPLWIASQEGHTNIVKVLLEAGADINKARNDGSTPLLVACFSNHIEVVKELIKKGADVNKSNIAQTPLTLSVLMGHIEIVKLLLDNGANINKPTSNGKTARDLALQEGYTDIVKLLDKTSVVKQLNVLNTSSRIIPAPAMVEIADYLTNLNPENKNYIVSRYATPNAERNAIPKPWYKTRKNRK
jgi:ankyrin repeat protein